MPTFTKPHLMPVRHQVIRNTATGAYFAGFQHVGMGLMKTNWSVPSEDGLSQAVLFTPAVPEETLRDLAQHSHDPAQRFVVVTLRQETK